MIYLTMTLAVFVIELMHVNQKKYASPSLWIKERWDNLLVSFISGVVLCISFPEIADLSIVKDNIQIAGYPSLAGLAIGLSSTPLINLVKAKTKSWIKKTKGQ